MSDVYDMKDSPWAKKLEGLIEKRDELEYQLDIWRREGDTDNPIFEHMVKNLKRIKAIIDEMNNTPQEDRHKTMRVFIQNKSTHVVTRVNRPKKREELGDLSELNPLKVANSSDKRLRRVINKYSR